LLARTCLILHCARQIEELGARVASLLRTLHSCEATRRACRPGSAKAGAAAQQRDVLAREIEALTALLTPHGFDTSDDEEADEEAAPGAAAAVAC
jgi:hypothetical protein